MSEIETITIGETQYALRQWPALPGWKFTRVILRILADLHAGVTLNVFDLKNAVETGGDFKVNPDVVDKVLSDTNMAQFLEMIAEGLNSEDGKELVDTERKVLRKCIGAWAFPDFISVIIAVLKHNLVFLEGHVTALFQKSNQSAISTQPAHVSPVSAESPTPKS